MSKWPTVSLGTVITALESGSRPKGGASQSSDGVPSLGGEHLASDGSFKWENLRFVPRDFFARMKRGQIAEGDVLVVKDGATTGKTAFVGETFPFAEAAINEHIFIVRVDKDRLIPRFAYYFLSSPEGQQQILSDFRGAAIGGISKNFVNLVHVPCPPLAEQQQIVNLLDEADAIRKLCAKADQRTADLIPALFHERFGDPITNPMGWPNHALGELLERIDGGWSPNCQDRPADLDEWGVLKLGSVTSCEYIDSENKALPIGYVPRPSLEVKCGDLLFSRKNTMDLVAACAYVFETRPKLMLSDLIFRLTIHPAATVKSLFLWALLTHPSKRQEVQRLASGSSGSMPNISKARLSTVQIAVPPLHLQEEFATQVDSVRSMQVEQVANQIRLRRGYQSLLHQAFSEAIRTSN